MKLLRTDGSLIIDRPEIETMKELVEYCAKEGVVMDYAKLNGANLNYAELNGAELNNANLNGANIDYSSWPLHCGSLKAKIGNRIARQLLFHFAKQCEDNEFITDLDLIKLLKSPLLKKVADKFGVTFVNKTGAALLSGG